MTETLQWLPWIAGAAIGLAMLAQYWITNTALGCSSVFGNVCARGGSRLALFRGAGFGRDTDWRLWFALGTPIGGLIAALTSPGPMQVGLSMGELYDRMLPASELAKAAWLFVGGILIGVGARMAGGCTSGHTIVGVSLLNPASIVASACFFAAAVATVQVMAHLAGIGGAGQ
ncbi:MAG: YeeE/YedE family protein [Halothiobacillaceae bacterium]